MALVNGGTCVWGRRKRRRAISIVCNYYRCDVLEISLSLLSLLLSCNAVHHAWAQWRLSYRHVRLVGVLSVFLLSVTYGTYLETRTLYRSPSPCITHTLVKFVFFFPFLDLNGAKYEWMVDAVNVEVYSRSCIALHCRSQVESSQVKSQHLGPAPPSQGSACPWLWLWLFFFLDTWQHGMGFGGFCQKSIFCLLGVFFGADFLLGSI